ncbi:hypothetical protein VPH35_133370 [Triticum aestivum]
MSSQGQKTFKILCRTDEDYCITVRWDDDGGIAVVMAPTNPRDQQQHWYKDTRFSSTEDEDGFPAFALVNKATGFAVKHSSGQSEPVTLVPYEYDPEAVHESVLWTESDDVGDGFRCIRMVNNIHLNFDALDGVTELQDGTPVVLWEWLEGANQSWKILPWGTDGGLHPALSSECTMRIFCSAGEEYSIAARDGAVCLAPADPNDDLQHWVKDMRHGEDIKDEYEQPAFALVNKATGEAIQHSLEKGHPVRLAAYDPDCPDESVMWTESEDVGDDFHCIRMASNIQLNFDAVHGGEDESVVQDGTTIILFDWVEGDNQRWKIVPW